MRGCGKQLVRWQLRALCKPWKCGKKCGKKDRVDISQSDRCRFILNTADSSHDHVTSHVTQGPQCTKGNKHQQHSSCRHQHQHSNNKYHGNYHSNNYQSNHHPQQYGHYHYHHENYHYPGHDNRHHYYHGNRHHHHKHHGNKEHNSSNGQKRDGNDVRDEKTARDATVNDTYWEQVRDSSDICDKYKCWGPFTLRFAFALTMIRRHTLMYALTMMFADICLCAVLIVQLKAMKMKCRSKRKCSV